MPLLDVYGGVQYLHVDNVHSLHVQQICADVRRHVGAPYYLVLYQVRTSKVLVMRKRLETGSARLP